MLTATFLTLLIPAVVLGYPSFDQSRIVGGDLARLGDFPFAVALQWRGSRGGHICGGSILSERWILTAAHCVNMITKDDIQIQYGVIDNHEQKNVRLVEEIIIHEEYEGGTNFPNDIAILSVSEDMNLDGLYAKAVNLPDYPLEIAEDDDSMNGQLCGWGFRALEEEQMQRSLLWTWVPIWKKAMCEQYLGIAYDSNYHVCAGSLDGRHGLCTGDTGSPLTILGTQYGVASWSYKPCDLENMPGLYTNVYNYRGWIRNKIGL